MRGSVDRKDLFLMLILSLLFFSIAVYDLGLLKIPVSGWNSSSDGEVNFDLGSQKRVDCLYVFLADSRPVSFDVYVEVSGSWQYQRSFYDSDYYNWKRLELHRVSTRFVKLVFHGSVGMVNEIYFVDEDGERIRIEQVWVEGRPVGDVENLIDEQELIENPPTYRSRTYFDEIYYVRTAENYIKGEEPYEWTHPPFGKLIIALSILSLGFNPFGWRFTGVLFASMMVPMVYILAKIMFRDRLAATFSASLLSLDFLHFTMGRIATVDTFAVFFILTSNIFFFITYQRLSGSEARFDGLNFLLGVLFFSLAFSTKWYALYGFIGQFLLILFFLIRSLRASRCGLKGLLKPLTIILGALVLALTVYASSFIPHLLLGHSLQDVITMQWSMYRYHSSLEATHPFSSPWWSWPLIVRPLWMDVEYLPGGMVSTIVAMGNPCIWWFSLPSLIVSAWKAVRRRDRVSIYIVSVFLFQWMPYVFITRCLFIYHFYMNVPVFILSIADFLKDSWSDRCGRVFVLGYLCVTLFLFVIFYPVISGVAVTHGYKESLRWFSSWLF